MSLLEIIGLTLLVLLIAVAGLVVLSRLSTPSPDLELDERHVHKPWDVLK